MNLAIDEIAESIRAARKSKALTQKELGQRVGLPQSHISKIEKGAVDLQLSSLVEITRALDLEVKLIPRRALPAVEGAIRAHTITVETSRALNLLNEQTQLAKRIKEHFPDLAEIEAFEGAIRSTLELQLEFDAIQLKALDDALRPAKRLKSLLDTQASPDDLAKQLAKSTTSLRHLRNSHAHPPFGETQRQLPAYRLDEEDE